MKKLISVNYKIWIAVFVTIILSIILTIFILHSKIESRISTNIQVTGFNKQTALIDVESAYKVKVGNSITFNINNSIHTGIIKSITFDEQKQKFAIEISQLDFDMLPGSNLSATIIYDTHKVVDSLFGSV